MSASTAALAQSGTPPGVHPADPRVVVSRDSVHKADASVAIRAMQLSSAQVQALASVRARYAPQLRAYVDQLSVLASQHASAATMRAIQDSLRTLAAAERGAVDSVVTPVQHQRFDSVMNAVHRDARVPARRRSLPDSGSAVPDPSTGRP